MREKASYALREEILKNRAYNQKHGYKTSEIIMGDFNDTPLDPSLLSLNELNLYLPFVELAKKGEGTTAFMDQWFLFDQMLYSKDLKGEPNKTYALYKTGVFHPDYLQEEKEPFVGYPKRFYQQTRFVGGYSDHFPVYGILIRKIEP
ncbi:MAG: hypothetical protein C4K58_00840 [Flavobacteriaceae bacterium]|nr:MAG: hypothetical protein C4K58_00840 [Flavobacteriaceae bacterium]